MNKVNISYKDNIAIVTINSPENLNAASIELLSELKDVFYSLSVDKSVAVIILVGSGKAFMAGADISSMRVFTSEQAFKFAEFGKTVFDSIENIRKVVIGAINGFALGGGCELAMACDIRISSSYAKFGQPEVSLGIIPGFDGTKRLTKLVGVGKAKELIFSGRTITADEAYNIGLVNNVVEPERLMSECLSLAEQIAAKSQNALEQAKKAINFCSCNNGQSDESQLFAECFEHEDAKEGLSAFLEKRKPVFC